MDQHAQIFMEWILTWKSLRYVLVGWVTVVTSNAERVVEVRINRESSIGKGEEQPTRLLESHYLRYLVCYIMA